MLNAGINGNALLTDSSCAAGEKALTRFARDVLRRPAVRTVIVLLGTNDIGLSCLNLGCGEFPEVTADQLIGGHLALIRTAHARGIRIIGAMVRTTPHGDPRQGHPHPGPIPVTGR